MPEEHFQNWEKEYLVTVEDYLKERMRILIDNALWAGGAHCYRHGPEPFACWEWQRMGRKTVCIICGMDPLDMNLNLIPEEEDVSASQDELDKIYYQCYGCVCGSLKKLWSYLPTQFPETVLCGLRGCYNASGRIDRETYEDGLRRQNLIAINHELRDAPPIVRSSDRRGESARKRQNPMGWSRKW